MTVAPLIVVADASFLINFLNLDRMDLMDRHPSKFWITDHVEDEVIEQSQQARLKAALENGILEKHPVVDSEDMDLFWKLRKELGSGESSAIAFALHRGYGLAIDDKKATKIARKRFKDLQIIKTQDLLLSLVQKNLLDISEADYLKYELETKYYFKMKFQSFAELMEN